MNYSTMTDEELENKYNGWRFSLNKRKTWKLMTSSYAEAALREMAAIQAEWDGRGNTAPLDRGR